MRQTLIVKTHLQKSIGKISCLVLFIVSFISGYTVQAQNTYPATGKVSLIGTSKTAEQLHIESSNASWNGVYVSNTSPTGTPGYGYQSNNLANDTWHYVTPNGDWRLNSNKNDHFTILKDGYVGIGTMTPAADLHVVSPSNTRIQVQGSSTTDKVSVGVSNSTGQSGYGYSTSNVAFQAMHYLTTSGDWRLNMSGHYYTTGDVLTVSKYGAVGIGTTSPSTLLELDNPNGPYITLKNTSPSNQGDVGINFGNNNGNQYALHYSFFPAFGGNGLHLEDKTGNNGVHVWTDKIVLGKLENETGALSATGGIILNGNVGIGTNKLGTNFRLSVIGRILADEIWIQNVSNWPDYVFANTYKVKTLEEVEQYVKENNHLPEVPSVKEIQDNGLNMGEMNATLLKKVEELTLYLIDVNKEIKRLQILEQEIQELKTENRMIKAALDSK